MKKYMVYAPVKNYCGIGAAGVQFAYGKAEVHEGWVLNWYKEHGYKVEEIKEDTQDDDAQGDGSKSLTRLKKEELIAYAEDNNIELGDAKTKDEILEVIKNQVQE